MPVNESILASLLPGDGAEWVPITTGESGVAVLRDHDGSRYAKIGTPEQSADLAGERDRTGWLDEAGIPVGAVLDWRTSDHGVCLVTRAVAGVPADQLSVDALRQAWSPITHLIREMHDIDASSCPFDRGVATMMSLARTTVAENRVQTEFLPDALQQVPSERILHHLEGQLPRRREQELGRPVVCHGDLCLPNILIDPDTQQVCGVIDLGRLGRADPYADIALLLTNARETWRDEHAARRADRDFADQYGIDLDTERLRFYLLLDPLTWPRPVPSIDENSS